MTGRVEFVIKSTFVYIEESKLYILYIILNFAKVFVYKADNTDKSRV